MSFTPFPEQSHALILGASSGFGGAAAIELARHGMHIIGIHMDRAATMPACEEVQEKIRNHGVDAHFYNINAADAEKRAETLDAVAALFAAKPGATIRVLMHSLAFGALKPLIAATPREALTQAQIEMTMNVMANSLVYWTQDVMQCGMMAPGGSVYAMTSAGSRRVLPMYGAVSAAKAALESYCRQLAFELGPHGVRVNAIQAGVTDTPALQKIPGAQRLIANALQRNPFNRLTTPEDVAKLIAILSTDEGAWISGTVIQADGGEDSVDIDWQKNNGEGA